jgi:hypothetical protein
MLDGHESQENMRIAFLHIDQVGDLEVERQIGLEVLGVDCILCGRVSLFAVDYLQAIGFVRMYRCRGVWPGSPYGAPKRSRAAYLADAASMAGQLLLNGRPHRV